MTSRRTKLNNVCQPFYMFLHGRPEDGSLSLSTGVARSLKDDWEVALADISYNQTREVEMREDDIQVVICARRIHHSQYTSVMKTLSDHGTDITEFKRDHFPKFPYAAIFTLQRRGTKVKTPSGRYALEPFITEMNKRLRNPDFFYGRGPMLIFENDTLLASWHYHKDYLMEVCCFPIFIAHVRRMIGMPEPSSDEFKEIVDNMFSDQDTVLHDWKFPIKRTPLLVECNLCDHNGLATVPHSCASDSEGHVLRVIGQDPEMAFGKHLNIEIPNRYYVPVRASGFTEVNVRILTAEYHVPVCFDGQVTIVLHFKPRSDSCVAVDEEAHPRRIRSRDVVTEFQFNQTYETRFKPFKTTFKRVDKKD